MTAKLSFVTATVGAALVFAVPAWGNYQQGDAVDSAQPASAGVPPDALERAFIAKENMLDARERALGATLVVAVPAAWGAPEPDAWSDGMNRLYGLGEYAPEVRAQRLRDEALNKQYGLGEYASTATKSIDARERAMSVGRENPTTSMLDAREQAFGARDTRPGDHFVANDNRFQPTTQPVPVSVTGSGDEIQWPQVGIGFGIGIALMFGLFLILRTGRERQPAV